MRPWDKLDGERRAVKLVLRTCYSLPAGASRAAGFFYGASFLCDPSRTLQDLSRGTTETFPKVLCASPCRRTQLLVICGLVVICCDLAEIIWIDLVAW